MRPRVTCARPLLACALVAVLAAEPASAQAKTCAAGGCTYQSLGCDLRTHDGLLNCYNRDIEGPIYITNVPTDITPNVTSMLLGGNKITAVVAGTFDGLASLNRLYLYGTRIFVSKNILIPGYGYTVPAPVRKICVPGAV